MFDFTPPVLILLIANVVTSIVGFSDVGFMDRFLFHIGPLKRGQWYRLVTCGFLHLNVPHLLLNMLALYSFGDVLVHIYGAWTFLLIYFAAELGGSFLSFFIHRNQDDYRALGASGAVSGAILAFVLVAPDSIIYAMFIPMPAWLFAVAYIGISILGMKKQLGNVGHDAHLGGAVTGALVVLLMYPQLFIENPLLSLAVVVLPIAYLLYEHRKDFGIKAIPRGGKRVKSSDLVPKLETPEEEMNRLLDKISREGKDSLSAYEQWRLDELSKDR